MSKTQGTEPIHGRPQEDKTLPSDEPRRLASEEASRVVKICKSCMASRSGGGAFCARCGEELVRIRSVSDSCIGQVVGGKYRIVSRLGSGGMGDVYLGLNEPLDQKVAVKFLNEKYTSDEQIVLRFLNEARSYCRISHPNAVTLLEYGQHEDGALYLITEYVDGEGLSELVKREGPLEEALAIDLGRQLCDVLSAAHRQGIIHRDLKPDNIMVIPGGRQNYALKVLDFGIAKIADDEGQGPRTETGSVFGTPEFMSPEQARGKEVDQRSDIYALGVILYYLTTGQFPFKGETKLSILNQQINDDPRRPSSIQPGVNAQLERVILACMAKDPSARPARADDVADALEAIEVVDHGPVSETTATILDLPSARRNSERRPSASVSSIEIDHGSHREALEAMSFDGEDDVAELGLELRRADEDPGDLRVPFHGELAFAPTDPSGDWDFGQEAPSDAPTASTYRRPPKKRWPLALATGVAGLALVGALTMWSPGGDSHAPSPAMGDSAAEVVHNAYYVAAIDAARAQVNSGNFSAANRMLATIDVERLDDATRKSVEDLVRRASRIQNLDMQIQAAIDANRCQRAQELADQLQRQWPGSGAARTEAIEACGKEPVEAVSEQEPQNAPRPQGSTEEIKEIAAERDEVPDEPAEIPADEPTERAGASDSSESDSTDDPPEVAVLSEELTDTSEPTEEPSESETKEVATDHTDSDEETEMPPEDETKEVATDHADSDEEASQERAERDDSSSGERVLPPSEI